MSTTYSLTVAERTEPEAGDDRDGTRLSRRERNTLNARLRRQRLVAAGLRPGSRWPDLATRLWASVQKGPDCWLWTGRLNTSGYGQIRVGALRPHAHRVVYEMLVGPIPDGLTLDHLCRNRACVNPAHLEPVTQGENNRRGFGFSGQNHRKTHCVKGHEFTPENTYDMPAGGRRCRECQRAYIVDWTARRSAA